MHTLESYTEAADATFQNCVRTTVKCVCASVTYGLGFW